jgi:hypothetical protein
MNPSILNVKVTNWEYTNKPTESKVTSVCPYVMACKSTLNSKLLVGWESQLSFSTVLVRRLIFSFCLKLSRFWIRNNLLAERQEEIKWNTRNQTSSKTNFSSLVQIEYHSDFPTRLFVVRRLLHTNHSPDIDFSCETSVREWKWISHPFKWSQWSSKRRRFSFSWLNNKPLDESNFWGRVKIFGDWNSHTFSSWWWCINDVGRLLDKRCLQNLEWQNEESGEQHHNSLRISRDIPHMRRDHDSCPRATS